MNLSDLPSDIVIIIINADLNTADAQRLVSGIIHYLLHLFALTISGIVPDDQYVLVYANSTRSDFSIMFSVVFQKFSSDIVPFRRKKLNFDSHPVGYCLFCFHST